MDIRTKFQVGDELFTLKDMKIISFRVQNISVFCAHWKSHSTLTPLGK